MKAPKVPKAQAPPPPYTGETTTEVAGARSRLRRRFSSMYGARSTLLTGGRGAGMPSTMQKTLLGA